MRKKGWDMKKFSISRYIFLTLMIYPFLSAAQSNQLEPTLYTTTKIEKYEKNKDEVLCKIGNNSPVPWCKSPCEKMYGKLPNVKCPQ
jgi:hypothetical protein